MTNLVQELGVAYIKERFQECMFLTPEGSPAFINSSRPWPRGQVAITVAGGSPSAPTSTDAELPHGFFSSLSVFAAPPLGWRVSDDGKYLVNFWRNNRSYHRAIAPANLHRRFAPSTRWLLNTNNLSREVYDSSASTALLVMQPRYTQFREGLEKMRRGEVLSFAVNPNIAVIPEVDNQQAVLFNNNRVAIVRPDGELSFTFPPMETLVQDQL